MADITGNREFHRSCPSEELTLFSVDASGNFVAELEAEAVHGHYNASTSGDTEGW